MIRGSTEVLIKRIEDTRKIYCFQNLQKHVKRAKNLLPNVRISKAKYGPCQRRVSVKLHTQSNQLLFMVKSSDFV